MNHKLKRWADAAEIRMGAGERTVVFRASTPAVDRHGTIVRPEGINTEKFSQNPIFVWAHDAYGGWSTPDPESVIGRVISWEKSDEAFDIEVEFAPKEANPRAEQALKLVKAGFLNAVSIGFIPLKMHDEEYVGDDGNKRLRTIYDEVELLEVSLVPIPSNPEAVALMRDMARAVGIPTVYNEGEGNPPQERADSGFPGLETLRRTMLLTRARVRAAILRQEMKRRLKKGK